MDSCQEQWLCFSFELEEVMGKLAESEVEFSKSKTKHLFGEESIEDEIEKQKVGFFIISTMIRESVG